MNHTRRRFLGCCGAALGGFALAACSRGETEAPPQPLDFDASTACALDGMLLADYPGPKGQIHYAGRAAPDWHCDTVELLAALLRPEQAAQVRAAYVQDMARADWDHPKGQWIDARRAFYVFGSKRKGSMGATAASFAEAAAADAFVAQYGGRSLAFAAVKPEMVDLSGGALHDMKM